MMTMKRNDHACLHLLDFFLTKLSSPLSCPRRCSVIRKKDRFDHFFWSVLMLQVSCLGVSHCLPMSESFLLRCVCLAFQPMSKQSLFVFMAHSLFIFFLKILLKQSVCISVFLPFFLSVCLSFFFFFSLYPLKKMWAATSSLFF